MFSHLARFLAVIDADIFQFFGKQFQSLAPQCEAPRVLQSEWECDEYFPTLVQEQCGSPVRMDVNTV